MRLRHAMYYDLDPADLVEDVRLRALNLIEDGWTTQGSFAALAGIPFTTATLWLRGARPLHSVDNLRRAWQAVTRLEREHYDVES